MKKTLLLISLSFISIVSFSQSHTIEKRRINEISRSFISIVSFSQSHTIEKRRINEKRDNVEFNICYPKFIAGEYANMLNNVVLQMFVSANSLDSAARFDTPEALFKETATKLYKIGVTKSIDPIKYTLFSGWQTFENKYIVSMMIDQYVDMGMAHPYVVCQDINVNLQTDKDFNPQLLVKDTTKLMAIAADVFCKDRNLPKNAMRIRTGLKYELSELPMAKVCGFSKKGFVLFYNRGEIAPKSAAAISIVVPYSEFKDLLPADFFEGAKTNFDGIKEGNRKVDQISRQTDRGARKQHRPRLIY